MEAKHTPGAPYGFGGHGGLVLWFDDDDMRYPTVAQVKKLPRDYSFVIGAPQKETGK